MSHGRPYRLCRALGGALADAEAALAGLGFGLHDDSADPPGTDVDITAVRTAFNRFKLLTGTVNLYCTSDIQSSVERHRVASGGTPRRV